MNIRSLNLKNKLINEFTNEEYFDLTAPSFIYEYSLGVRAIHYVLLDQVGRIDKISELYFGTAEHVDAICVINNIFNPLSIEEGDILVIPNLNRPDMVYKKPELIKNTFVEDSKFINEQRQTEEDKNRISRLLEKAKTKKTGVKNPLPPNMLQPDSDVKKYADGNITLGTNLPNKKITR